MTLYEGDFLGIKYRMEFDTEKEMIDWLAEMMQVRSSLTVRVLKKLMEQT